MPGSFSSYAAIAASALVMAAFVPGLSDAATVKREAQALARKGDRLSPDRIIVRREVASMHAEGPAHSTSVTMRLRDGSLAFVSDANAAVTLAVKNVSLPPLPVAEPPRPSEPPASVATSIPRSLVERSAVSGTVAVTTMPIGCERLVSVLVMSPERNRVGRCLS